MKNVDLYLKVRHAVRIEGLSERAAARRFGIDPRTVNKMMKFSVPPGYVRKKPPAKPKLDPFILVIDGILDDDKSRPKKQQHTAKRIFERLRDEHGFTGGITIVKDYVAGWRQRTQEMFVPLVHPPGHAQADFGEAIGVIGGVERKIHFFAFDLPQSDAGFVVGYPAETTEEHQVLHGIEADGSARDGVAHRGSDLIGAEYLHQPQNLDEFALALLAHPGFQKPPQRGELLRQPPAGQRCGLVERANLLLDQRQVVQRLAA